MRTSTILSFPLVCLSFFVGCADDPNGASGDGDGAGTGGMGAAAGPGTGGGPATGGGSSQTGGSSPGSGGAATDSGGSVGSGGAVDAGSGGGSGGASSGSGGATTGSGGSTEVSDCSEGDQQVCDNNIGTHCGYTYEYWKDQGTGCLTNTADGFSVEWNNINNLLGRKGIRPGSANHVVTYNANYNPNGNSYLCVYGWSQGPLAEYYIVDSWGSWRPPGGEGFVGTVDSDGGTYDIYKTTRVNQPSIEGNATFDQYWSVRQSKRESGTITVKNHFDAWASHGMNMGSVYEVSMTVEGYQSSGSADVSLSIQ